MNITKSHLSFIIKEELLNVLCEGDDISSSGIESIVGMLSADDLELLMNKINDKIEKLEKNVNQIKDILAKKHGRPSQSI
jgi:hypothetical protein